MNRTDNFYLPLESFKSMVNPNMTTADLLKFLNLIYLIIPRFDSDFTLEVVKGQPFQRDVKGWVTPGGSKTWGKDELFLKFSQMEQLSHARERSLSSSISP